MRFRPALVHARLLALAIAAGMTWIVLTGASGCGATGGSSVSATGSTLKIVVSVPPGASSQTTQDVLAAEQLAFDQLSHGVTAVHLELRRVAGSELSANARTAIQDKSAIAYLGEIIPGDSADSVGITNAQSLLQVSPTDTAQALTQKTSAVSGSPNRYYESLKSYGKTFARVVPTTAQEASALLAEMGRLGIHHLYVGSDGSSYGRALATSIAARAGGLTVTQGPPTASGPAHASADAVLFAGRSTAAARTLFSGLGTGRSAITGFAPSAFADAGLAAPVAPAGAKLYVSSPGLAPSAQRAEAKQFATQFAAAYHHAPAAQAVFGYEAMAAVLAVLHQAGGSVKDRATVVHDFFNLRDRQSVLGTYSIDSAGDTSLDAFVIEQLKNGRLVPLKVG